MSLNIRSSGIGFAIPFGLLLLLFFIYPLVFTIVLSVSSIEFPQLTMTSNGKGII